MCRQLVVTILVLVWFAFDKAAPSSAIDESFDIDDINGTMLLNDSVIVNNRLFKAINFGRNLSHETAQAFIRLMGLPDSSSLVTTLAMLRNSEENTAVSDFLIQKGIRNVMIGLKQKQTLWKWLANEKSIRRQGYYPLPRQLVDDYMNLTCNRDCISVCRYFKRNFAFFHQVISIRFKNKKLF